MKRYTDNCTTPCRIQDGYNDNENDDDIPSDHDDDEDMFSDDVQNAFADYETEVL